MVTGLKDLVRWRGLMTDESRSARRAGMAFLAIAACSMVATQTNYFVIGGTHVIAALAPITACAMLYGSLASTVVGALTGMAELLHAQLLPLDAYELTFALPTNSLLLFTLMGLFMGVLFAWSDRHTWRSDRQGLLALLACCAVGSTLFSLLFLISVNVFGQELTPGEIPSDVSGGREMLTQIAANFCIIALLCVGAGTVNRVRTSHRGQHTLRDTFQGWLAVVVSVAYLMTAALGYSAISIACRQSAEHRIEGQMDYLTGQLTERDSIMEAIRRRTQLSDAKLRELHASSIYGIARGMQIGDNGICAVAENGTIVSSNVDTLLGASFEEVIGAGLISGFDESLYDQKRSTLWYMDSGELGYLRIARLGYMRISQRGTYQVMAAMPSSEVFALRPLLMAFASAIFIGLFAAVYAQASILLKNVVVRSIDETNRTLALITDGDLDQRVLVNEPVEFARLSSGINATVGSLKKAIAAESARIERDLITAKAIQESALPNVFPPFPEIEAFDIYASMNAAREVGGDFYDLFVVGEHSLAFLVADVSGKGIPAALFMMAAKTEIANNIQAGMELAMALQTANWHLCQANDAGMFVTVWAALLDWETGRLTFVNAGHNPPLLRHEGSWQWLRTRGGLFLGTYDTAKYRSTTITLSPGDEILVYTDGVNEAFSVSSEQYGDERLEAFLADHAHLHPHALVDSLRDDLAEWAKGAEQSDDITMLALEYGVPPEASGTITVPATLEHLDDILDLLHMELGKRRCPISTQHQLDVAVEELFVNVCHYAYANQDQPGSCRLDYVYNANPHSLTVSLTDWGIPFNPLERDDPETPRSIDEATIGGLGIFMTKQLTDDLSYVRDGHANVIAFKKTW